MKRGPWRVQAVAFLNIFLLFFTPFRRPSLFSVITLALAFVTETRTKQK